MKFNECLLVHIVFARAKNVPPNVCCMMRAREPWLGFVLHLCYAARSTGGSAAVSRHVFFCIFVISITPELSHEFIGLALVRQSNQQKEISYRFNLPQDNCMSWRRANTMLWVLWLIQMTVQEICAKVMKWCPGFKSSDQIRSNSIGHKMAGKAERRVQVPRDWGVPVLAVAPGHSATISMRTYANGVENW